MEYNPNKDRDWHFGGLSGSHHGPVHAAGTVLPRWRCRPDGVPRWVALEISPPSASQLRARARAAGVTVDAWLGIALAVRDAQRGSEVSLSRLSGHLDAIPVSISPDRRLSSWQEYLSTCDGPGLNDELPEVVLSPTTEVFGAQIQIIELLAATSDVAWQLGRKCEIRAAGLGVPLAHFMAEL